MDPEPDVIRQEIEQTRESLTGKIENLEKEVRGTISNVTETVENITETVKEKVQDTVETVKQTVSSTVEDTVATVKRTFDIPYQVQQHPWAIAGCSLAAGLAAGYFLAGRRGLASRAYDSARHARRPDVGPGYQQPAPSSYQPAASNYQPAASSYQPPRAEPGQPGVLSRMLAPFESEINKVKETAVGALMGVVRDFLKRSLPPTLAANVDEIMNSATRKVGGAPVQGSVLPSESGGGASRSGGGVS
jgi:ElaB/YqjD/DUF883 family membrane-anchored ribosome-binding protein